MYGIGQRSMAERSGRKLGSSHTLDTEFRTCEFEAASQRNYAKERGVCIRYVGIDDGKLREKAEFGRNFTYSNALYRLYIEH
jgi:hypothetical protein